jgi:GNAT superfamily N-acetyltransferase
MPDLHIRIAGVADITSLAMLRAAWTEDAPEDPDLGAQLGTWLAAEGERRTTWLATLDDRPVGMASLFEYRRMPRPGRLDSRWGYVSNMFVLGQFRNRGVGTGLLQAIISVADERSYARLVLSPSREALAFYRRAGFVVPDERLGDDRLLVRPTRRP